MVLKKTIPLYIFLFCCTILIGQTIPQYRDSIRSEIKKLSSDSLKGGVYYNAARHVIEKIGDLKLYRSYCDSAMHYARISGHKDLEAKCHFAYGFLERLSGNYELALKHLDTNITYFQNDSLMKPYAMFQVGVIHNQLGDKNKSLKTYLEILKIFEYKKDSFAMASTLNSIAKIYGEMENYDEAISNFNSANLLFMKKGEKRDVSNTSANIADIYLTKKDTVTSRKYAFKALEVAEEIDFQPAICRAMMALGKTHLKSNPKKALKYYLEAKPIAEKAGIGDQLIAVHAGLGASYVDLNLNIKAIQHYEQALKFAENSKALPEVKSIFKDLAEVYEQQQKFNIAYQYQTKYLEINDSLASAENIKALNLLQKQFETEKKDKEITEQQLQLEQQQNDLQKKQVQYSVMTGIAIILLVTSLMGWFLYQQRQKRKNQEILALKREQQVKTLESLMKGEEQERLRIAKELHDGVNGDLSAIKYKLTAMVAHNSTVVSEVVKMLDRSSEQVRAISHNLVPPALEKFNLVDAMADYCSSMNDVHKPQIDFQLIGRPIELSKNNEVNIYRIVQELVSNSIKHAEASEITVQISHRQNHIQITVEDNGIGFDKDAIEGYGIGLKNIRSRVDYLGANMDFVSNPEGTSYIIDIDTSNLNDN